jgi:hypothetical protein
LKFNEFSRFINPKRALRKTYIHNIKAFNYKKSFTIRNGFLENRKRETEAPMIKIKWHSKFEQKTENKFIIREKPLDE